MTANKDASASGHSQAVVFGFFCHIEYVSQDIKASRTFYENVFKWPFVLAPGMEDTYPMFAQNPAIGGGIRPADKIFGHQHTVPFLYAKDIKVMVKDLTNGGAKVLEDIKDVMGHGQMAYVSIPGGIVVGVWESAKPEVGSDEKRVKNVPGIQYTELASNSFKETKEFLEKVLHWEIKEMMPGVYAEVKTPKDHPDVTGIGLRAIEPDKKEDYPGAISYLTVKEIDDYKDALAAAGAKILIPKHPIHPGAGDFFSYNLIPGGIVQGLYQEDPVKKAQKEPAFGYLCHIDYHTSDVAATRSFYEKVWGWKVQTYPGFEDYPMFNPTPKIGGGIAKKIDL